MTQPETPTPAPNGEAAGTDAAAAPPPAGGGAATSPGELRLRLFARTDVGQIREHNEDNFLVADLTRRSRGLLESNRQSTVGPLGNLFAVCDGMGGAAAGEIASQLAVDIIYEKMVEGLDKRPAVDRDELARRLVRAVETAGLRIFQEAKADRSRRGMGTTVTAAALVDDHLFFAQVGDSRGYLLRGGVLTQVTRDQSLVNQLIEAGQLTAEEAETFEHNNIILQALGTADTVQVDLTYARVQRGDMMLLCSDGLSGMVRFDEIREAMTASNEPVDICKSLTERANQAGGHDNITVIIVSFDGEALSSHAEGDEALKYRKYPLPEEPVDATERMRHSPGDLAATQNDPSAPALPTGTPDAAVHGDPRGAAAASRAADGWHEQGPHSGPQAGEERIDIPGTHVPAWVVVAIVLGVVAVLASTAFFLVR